MNPALRSGIIVGVLGGFVVLIFGGWSVMLIGAILGASMSMTSQVTDKSIQVAARRVAVPASAAGAMLVAFSALQNFVVAGLAGFRPSPLDTFVPAALLGFAGLVLYATLIACVRTLPPVQARLVILVILAVSVAAFPFVDKGTGLRWTPLIIFALIFVILGLGLNIVVGFAGLLDLGYAAFFAIGAYTTGILSSPQFNIHWNFWIVIWVAAAVAAIFGFILGSPTLPLRGDYLAIVTLGFGEIVPVIFKNLIKVTIEDPLTCWILPSLYKLVGATNSIACFVLMKDKDLTAGEKGMNPIGRPWLPFIGEFQSDNAIPWYFLIIGIIIRSIFLIRRLHNSRLGRAWMAIREDELVASQMGINPVRTKLLAFALGATFSGFAGAFYGAYISAIFPSVFDFSVSIIVLVTIILGGLGNINGVIVGGLVVMTADRLFLPALKDLLKGILDHSILPSLAGNPTLQAAVRDTFDPIKYRFLLFGLTLVIMMAIRPEGLFPSQQRRAELHGDEDDSEADEIAEEMTATT